MSVFLVLSFATENNFTKELNDYQVEKEKISKKEVMETLSHALLVPVKKCMREKRPHLFMTKCYNRFIVLVDEGRSMKHLNEFKDTHQFSTQVPFKFELKFDDCGDVNHICNGAIYFAENKILIRESYLSNRVEVAEFLEKWCEKLSESN